MHSIEQVKAPACHKCDDLGVVAGNEVFSVDVCDCPEGSKLLSVEPRNFSFRGSATQFLALTAAPDRRTKERTEPYAATSMETIAKTHAKTIMSHISNQFQVKDMEDMIAKFIVRAMGQAVPMLVNESFDTNRTVEKLEQELADVKAALATAEQMLAARPNLQLVELTPADQPSILDAMMAEETTIHVGWGVGFEPEDGISHGMGA